MSEESTYWNQFWKRRISRRRLIGGAAIAGTGLAAAAAVGCGSDDNGNGNGTRTPAPSGDLRDLPATFPNDGRREFSVPPDHSRGGTLRFTGFDSVVLDRYDPHQTQFGPMYANLSTVFSKLYMYASHSEPTWENILPDLAESAPEMIGDPPDTYVIRLRQGVKFHDTPRIRGIYPDLAGRELTADDVIFSFERQFNRDSPQRPYYYRSSQYETIESIEKVDDYTIRITTKGPIAPFYHFMADTNAMIIPKEIVFDDLDSVDFGPGPRPEERMIGTGPFIWEQLVWGTSFTVTRNPEWFGWGDPDLNRPYLDRYVSTGVVDDATIESLFRDKRVDVAGFVDNPGWIVRVMDEIPGLEFQRQQTSGWVNSRLKTYAEPFQDWRVRRALFLAADRQDVVDVIGSGQWDMVGPVGGAIEYWAISDDELADLPGYRRREGREEDRQEARQLFEAAGSPTLPEPWFADQPGYIPRFAPTYIREINDILGTNLRTDVRIEPYSRIAEALVTQDPDLAPFTWGFDNGWIDLDDWVYPYFVTDGPKNSFGVSDPVLDEMLEAQRRDFDWESRRELGYRIQRYLLGLEGEGPAVHTRLDYASPGGGAVSWPYYKNRTSWPWFGNNYWSATVWLDRDDPTFQGRPS